MVPVGMGDRGAVPVKVSAERFVGEPVAHATEVSGTWLGASDDRVLEDHADDPGDGHHVDDGQFRVPAVEGGEGAERDQGGVDVDDAGLRGSRP